jgi:hypothetical protein
MSIRIPKELEERMRRLRSVNWSELIRRFIEESVNRVARKVAKGKKLSDQEIVILYLDIIMKSNKKRFEMKTQR